MARRSIPVLALLVALAGCGGDEAPGDREVAPERAARPADACSAVSARTVAEVVRRASAARIGALDTSPEDTTGLASCDYRSAAVHVNITVDSASQAARRYFNSLVERQQFHASDPKLRAQPVKGVGADEELGGQAAAYWVSAERRLTAYGGGRFVKVSVEGPGLGERASRRAARPLARAALKARGR